MIDYHLESEYDVKILDPNFVKLFRLAQLAVEYLLYCKQYLDQSVVILKEELKYKIEENVRLKEESGQLQEAVKEIKEKFKERSKEQIKSDSHGEIHKVNWCMFHSCFWVLGHRLDDERWKSKRYANVISSNGKFFIMKIKLENESFEEA